MTFNGCRRTLLH